MSDKDTVNVTIVMTGEERRMLKIAALDGDTTISKIVRGWIHENLDGDSKKKRR